MNTIPDGDYKSIFEDLVSRYKDMLNQYYEMTRNQDCREVGGDLAFDMNDLFKHAQQVLPEDPENPYCFAEFEKEYFRLKDNCFGEECADGDMNTVQYPAENDTEDSDMSDYENMDDDAVGIGLNLETDDGKIMDLQGKNIPLVFCTEIKVRGYHLDLFGHVNNARYLEFLEEARWSLLDTYLDSDILMKKGIVFAVVNININYRKAAGFQDVLDIYAGLSHIGNKSVTLYQEARLRGTNTAVADAEVTFVLADAKTGKSVPVDEEFEELLNALR